jgi:hypothetical protein
LTSVFFSYSHADEVLRDQLEKQLAVMRRQGVITAWHDRRIGAGEDFGAVIDHHLETDDIILLLVSPDFLASDYCYEREMGRALERHHSGAAIVIPVILRACEWKHSPFGKLLATPPDGKPVTLWTDRDDAFFHVAQAIRDAVRRVSDRSAPPLNQASTATAAKVPAVNSEGSKGRRQPVAGAGFATPANNSPSNTRYRVQIPVTKSRTNEKPTQTSTTHNSDSKPERRAVTKVNVASVRFAKSEQAVVFAAELSDRPFRVVIPDYHIDNYLKRNWGSTSPNDCIDFVIRRLDALATFAGRKFIENPAPREVRLSADDLRKAEQCP